MKRTSNTCNPNKKRRRTNISSEIAKDIVGIMTDMLEVPSLEEAKYMTRQNPEYAKGLEELTRVFTGKQDANNWHGHMLNLENRFVADVLKEDLQAKGFYCEISYEEDDDDNIECIELKVQFSM